MVFEIICYFNKGQKFINNYFCCASEARIIGIQMGLSVPHNTPFKLGVITPGLSTLTSKWCFITSSVLGHSRNS